MIEELIQTADRLCASLDQASQNEKKFCDNICDQLERMSWETMRLVNDLRQIQEYIGN
jgi:hypothetical protein